MSLAEDWLQTYPQINVYACMNDDMAIGVIQALKGANKNMDNILVLGVDGTAAGLQYLKTGELNFTVAQDVNVATKVTFDTMVKILNGEKVDKLVIPHSFKGMTQASVK
jgi:inositol transport system substrate-binding protein